MKWPMFCKDFLLSCPLLVKTIAIGAGFSGLSIARVVHVGLLAHARTAVYEKNPGVGGMWYAVSRCR